MKITRVFLAMAALFTSYGAFSMAQWNRVNRPSNMGNNFERTFNKLPKTGNLTTTPWSGDYWPTYKGGITYRWNQKGVEDKARWSYKMEEISNVSISIDELSPAEKYDLFLGREGFPLTTYERNRTKILKTIETDPSYDKDFEIPTWEGLCHAWAPATLHFGEPEPITVTGKNGHKITFGSSDLKALLTYHLHLNKAHQNRFLGSRCNLDFAELRKKQEAGDITKEELDSKINSSACADTNAGAFHVALTNQISLLNEGFVVDITRDQEVWNQPVTGYSYKVYKTTEGASVGAAPGTVKEIWIKTTLKYIVEVTQTFELFSPYWRVKKAYYDYRVELNKDGQIIGGEWNSEERPDFIWKNKPPRFKGYFKQLEDLFNKSTAYLNPSKYTEELKAKFKKLGKTELLKKNVVTTLKISAAKTRAKKILRKDFVKGLVLSEFKTSGKLAKDRRIGARVALLKKESKKDFLAKKFIESAKEEVRDTHINAFKDAFKKDHKVNFLKGKFVEGAKELVRDRNILAAKVAFKKDHKPKFLRGKFIKEVSADAKETRRVKEARKAAAKAEVLRAATTSFLSKKFVKEVSIDAKKARKVKEENKKVALAKLSKKITQDFITNKFITDVKADAVKTRVIKEARKAAAKLEVLKASKKTFLTKKFISEVKADAVKTRVGKDKVIAAVKSADLKTLRGLLKGGTKIDFTHRESGLTPLMMAVKSRNLRMVKLMISKLDAKGINVVDLDGKNALIWSIVGPGEKPNKATRNIVKALIKAGIDLKAEDKQGMSALDYVSIRKYRSRRISLYLKAKGA